MDREPELKIIRRAFAKQVMAACGIRNPRVEAAFAAVAREDFLGPGPFQTWKPVFGGSRKHFCCFTRTFSRRTITAEVGKLGNRNAAEMPTIRASGRVEHGADRRQSGARAKAGWHPAGLSPRH